MNTIGIIGLGYVGTAVMEGFKSIRNIVTYDISKECTESSAQSVASKAQIIFICVPTPMNTDGTCNIDIVISVLSQISMVQSEYKPICVLKSTVPPGTTEKLSYMFPNLTICFNPEFLTEKNYIKDFISQTNIIIGYTHNKSELVPVENLYEDRFWESTVWCIKSTEAEMIKYAANTLLSTKVAFLNEIWQICQKTNINYNVVANHLSMDRRLGNTHWQVPGPDNHFGFGGTCFPKDLNALIHFSEHLGQPTPLLKAIWEKNLEMRPERDWEHYKGRAVV